MQKVVSLARDFPYEFMNLLREGDTGAFHLDRSIFESEFPGHYLRLVNDVHVEVVALVPPSQSISATLESSGNSTVIKRSSVGDFHEVAVRRGYQSLPFSAPRSDQSIFKLDPQSELLRPFEGMGIVTDWAVKIPKLGNNFDLNTIADVIITFDYSAQEDSVYRKQVLEAMPLTAERTQSLSLRNDFSDAWYELHNWDGSDDLVVDLELPEGAFPPNLFDLRVDGLALFMLPAEDSSAKMQGQVGVQLQRDRDTYPTDPTKPFNEVTPQAGFINSSLFGGSGWATGITGQPPTGTWKLKFPATDSHLFRDKKLDDVIFAISYSGARSGHPMADKIKSKQAAAPKVSTPADFLFAEWLYTTMAGSESGYLADQNKPPRLACYADEASSATTPVYQSHQSFSGLVSSFGSAVSLADGPLVDDDGYSWSFSGRGVPVSLDDSAAMSGGSPVNVLDLGTEDFSLMAVVRDERDPADPADGYIFSKEDSAGTARYAMWTSQEGALNVAINDGTNRALVTTDGVDALNMRDGKSHLVVAVGVRTTDNKLRLYVDGELVDVDVYVNGNLVSSGDISAVGSLDNNGVLYVGGRSNNDSILKGRLDTVAVLDQALDEAEIERIFEVAEDRDQALVDLPMYLDPASLTFWTRPMEYPFPDQQSTRQPSQLRQHGRDGLSGDGFGAGYPGRRSAGLRRQRLCRRRRKPGEQLGADGDGRELPFSGPVPVHLQAQQHGVGRHGRYSI